MGCVAVLPTPFTVAAMTILNSVLVLTLTEELVEGMMVWEELVLPTPGAVPTSDMADAAKLFQFPLFVKTTSPDSPNWLGLSR